MLLPFSHVFAWFSRGFLPLGTIAMQRIIQIFRFGHCFCLRHTEHRWSFELLIHTSLWIMSYLDLVDFTAIHWSVVSLLLSFTTFTRHCAFVNQPLGNFQFWLSKVVNWNRRVGTAPHSLSRHLSFDFSFHFPPYYNEHHLLWIE